MKATLKILLRNNYQTKEGKRQVCIRYTSYRQSTFIGLNISVHPKHWNDSKKQVKATEPHHIRYNQIIKEQYHKAESIILDNFLKTIASNRIHLKAQRQALRQCRFLHLYRTRTRINQVCTLTRYNG